MRVLSACALIVAALIAATPAAQGRKYVGGDGRLRVALTKQPLSPTGPSKGPDTMANGGIQKILADLGATVRVEAAALTPDEETEYGGWKRLGMSHGNKVPNGPSSEQLAALFERIFAKYEKASAIGFATIPPTDEGALSIAAFNRMVAGAVRGLALRGR